ncbi:MAG: pyrroloquinoline quinone precursor peptide PqqA [Gammaproteobacteria bacterium]|nr:pyrroloquinoline quinone precursor peptide PqqA [Gammaproteobacteria bacterium]
MRFGFEITLYINNR